MDELKGKKTLRAETLIHKMTRQEALMVIAMHANKAFSTPGDDVFVQNTERLVSLSQRHPLFDESIEDIRKRIYRLVNMESMHGHVNLLQKAIDVLSPDLYSTALTWVEKMLEPQRASDTAKKEVRQKMEDLLKHKMASS